MRDLKAMIKILTVFSIGFYRCSRGCVYVQPKLNTIIRPMRRSKNGMANVLPTGNVYITVKHYKSLLSQCTGVSLATGHLSEQIVG